MLRGSSIPKLFGGLRYIVIDEMHAFLGTERGAQLVSLLHRLDLAADRRIVRVGLSATLGDISLAARQLRPAHPEQVAVVVSQNGGQDLRLAVRGYTRRSPPAPRRTQHEPADTTSATTSERDLDTAAFSDRAHIEDDQEPASTPEHEIVAHLFAVLRGTDNLVFADSRGQVEKYADLLRRRSEAARLPDEFLVHHGSLAKSLREDVEAALKDPSRPTTAVATTTLEMGIDIGSVTSIAQIGPPPSVASLRQRLGRSGRRDAPAILRAYLTETELDARSSLDDELRSSLVQTIAMFELLLKGWCEPPSPAVLHTSTLVQQLLSLIAQHGGVTPLAAHRTLCGPDGPFAGTSPRRFAQLLHSLAAERVLEQDPDGTLLFGPVGERTVNHYTFYSAFQTPAEYRLRTARRQLGTLPIDFALRPGLLLVFAGQRWRVTDIDHQQRAVDLVPAAGGRPPSFSGSGRDVHDTVRMHMRTVLASGHVPAFLDPAAIDLLDQARQAFQRQQLAERSVLDLGSGSVIVPWVGTTTSHTLALELQAAGVDVSVDGLALTCPRNTRADVLDALRTLVANGPADPFVLAGQVAAKTENKYEPWLSEHLLCQDYAARRVDTRASHAAATRLLQQARAET